LTKDEKCLSIILYGTAALWAIYHGFICLIKNFIRAERLHDFELHLAIVAKLLPIFAAAGRGQSSTAVS